MVVRDNSSLCKLCKISPFILIKELPDFSKNKFNFVAKRRKFNAEKIKEIKGRHRKQTDEGAFSIVSLFLFKSFLVQTVHLLIEVNKIC